MKNILSLYILALLAFVFVYSCSSEEEDTSPPPSIITTPKPEPEPTPATTQYTLTVTAGEGGSVSTEGGTYDEGTSVTITATPNEGYEFVRWVGFDSNLSNISLTLNTNSTLYAIFQKMYYSINYGQIFVESPSKKSLINNLRKIETEDFKINEIGWLGIEMREFHNGGFYGTGSIDPGFFDFVIMNNKRLDLNNDGIEDLIFTAENFPHTVMKESNMGFLVLLNNNDGTFDFGNDLLDSEILNANHPYRIEKGDFNGDGIDDFVATNIGDPIVQDGITYASAALPVLALSNSNGTFSYSTLSNIYGMKIGEKYFEEDYGLDSVPDWVGHETISVADFDNDNDLDIFLQNKILYNDGKGLFTVNGFQFSKEIIERTYSSKAKDLNNDGYADLIFSDMNNNKKVYILISSLNGSEVNYEKIELPTGYFGDENNNPNYIECFDINNDGFQDILIGSSRKNPYYLGSAIQVIINQGGISFIDQTSNFIASQDIYDNFDGQGYIDIIDFDNDNDLDIIHQTSSRNSPTYGTNIYVNNNGFFEIFDFNKIPFISWKDFLGYEIFWDDSQTVEFEIKQSIFPIRINNKVSFVSSVETLGPRQRITHEKFYTIQPK